MDIIEQLRRDEGVRRRVYKDTKGIDTIGVGRNLQTAVFSDDEIDLMLKNDVAHFATQLADLSWFKALDDVRQGAILNMAFNLGLFGLMKFEKMIAALKDGNWSQAASEMMGSAWHVQVGQRCDRLAKQIETGEWQ